EPHQATLGLGDGLLAEHHDVAGREGRALRGARREREAREVVSGAKLGHALNPEDLDARSTGWGAAGRGSRRAARAGAGAGQAELVEVLGPVDVETGSGE